MPTTSKQIAAHLRITVEEVYAARRALSMAYAGSPMALSPQEVERIGAYLRDPVIAHCGQWHPCTALPWTCPLCGETLGGTHG